MCRTIHALLTVIICGVQMLVRVFMTMILMIENVIRMFLQTLYNFISFLLQLISLIPICCVFFATSRLKCFMCGGGGPCPVRRGGGCDCLMSAVAIIILFFIFRATGVLDKIFYSIGYAKAAKHVAKFSPTPGTITECSRNDTLLGNATTLQQKANVAAVTTNNAIATIDNAVETTDNAEETKDGTADTTATEIMTTSLTDTDTTLHRDEEGGNNETKQRRMGNENPIGNAGTDDNGQIIDYTETNSTQTDEQIIYYTQTNKTQTDEDTQIIDNSQSNNTETDEDTQTTILYYDTKISVDNFAASTKTTNDINLEIKHDREDANSLENETTKPTEKIKPVDFNLKISIKATRSTHDTNYDKAKLKGWLDTSISYYMV